MSSTKFRNDLLFSSGVKIGSASNYLNIDEGGNLSLSGDATAYEDLQLSLTTGKQGSQDKPSFDFENCGYIFPRNSSAEKLYLITQMPHAYSEGSRIYPHLHWQQWGGSAISWKMDYKWYNNGDIAPSAWTTEPLSSSVYAWTSGSLAQISHTASGIDGTGKTISSMILIKLYRDDNTYAASSIANQLDIHFERDAFGSRTQWTK